MRYALKVIRNVYENKGENGKAQFGTRRMKTLSQMARRRHATRCRKERIQAHRNRTGHGKKL
jgi:hypothetical protein